MKDVRDPANWKGRLALFVIYPVAAAVMAVGLAMVLVFAWPCCLIVHKLPHDEEST